jgi:outer membrane lipoprotein carrier protein
MKLFRFTILMVTTYHKRTPFAIPTLWRDLNYRINVKQQFLQFIRLPLVRILSACSALLLTTAPLSAQNFTPVKDVTALKKKLQETSASIKTIACDFTQEKFLSVLEAPVVSNGKFYYQAEDKVRWEIITPDPYLVIINGAKITIRDQSKTRSYDTRTNRMFARINEVMMASVKGSLGNQADKYEEHYLESSSAYKLRLIPKDKSAKKYLSEINVFFDKTSYDVTGLSMLEPNGDHTDMHFLHKSLNATLPVGVFEVK